MTTRHAHTQTADSTAPSGESDPLLARLKAAAVTALVLLAVAVTLPLWLMVCASQARADEELEDRGFG